MAATAPAAVNPVNHTLLSCPASLVVPGPHGAHMALGIYAQPLQLLPLATSVTQAWSSTANEGTNTTGTLSSYNDSDPPFGLEHQSHPLTDVVKVGNHVTPSQTLPAICSTV
jgi:hypothetical protein